MIKHGPNKESVRLKCNACDALKYHNYTLDHIENCLHNPWYEYKAKIEINKIVKQTKKIKKKMYVSDFLCPQVYHLIK